MSKIALVLEGGAMRGVYTSGVLDSLLENNIEFDNVYGISAGSKNSQYFISKQIGEAIRVDLHCARNRKAVSFRNFLFKGGFINRFYYRDYILKEFAPIDKEAFDNNKQNYYIGATNCNTGEIHYFDGHGEDLPMYICASCSMPVLQSMIIIDKVPYLDGAVAEAISYAQAYKDGCTKQVLVLTRPKGFRQRPHTLKMKQLYQRLYKKYPLLLEKLLSMPERYNTMLDEIDRLEKENKIICIRPSKTIHISRLEKDTKKLEELYELGKKDLNDKLDKLIPYFTNDSEIDHLNNEE